MPDNGKTPVTVLTGYLGAGKTTLLKPHPHGASRQVFIGRNLDREELNRSFRSCLA